MAYTLNECQINQIIGWQLKRMADEAQMSTRRVSRESGLDEEFLQNVFDGKQSVTEENLRNLAAVFGRRVYQVMDFSPVVYGVFE